MAKPDIPLAELDPDLGWHPDTDTAALHAAKGIGKGLEQAGVLYKNASGQFSASKPVGQGARDEFSLRAKSQPGQTIAGIFHNHPGTDDNGQVFSPRDIAVADQLKVPSYVYFEKTGVTRKYVPGQTATRSIPDPVSPRNRVKVADGDPVVAAATAAALAPDPPAADAPPPAAPQGGVLVAGQELTNSNTPPATTGKDDESMADTTSPTANANSGTTLNSLYTQNPGITNATATQAADPTPVTTNNATAATVNPGGTLAQAQQYSAAQNTVDPDQLASNQLADITSQDSPLMEQADSQAKTNSNSRGLLNSSFASGASEAAMVQAATPLAEQNAATEANSSLANQAATNQASAQNASLGTQVSTTNAATQAQIASLNAQMSTAVSQGNAQQANAIAEQLQQLQTQTGQFNSAQTNTANLQNSQEANAMTSQVLQANSSLNQQFLAGTQSEDLATIQGRYQNLIASNTAASSLYNSYMNSIAATMSNTNLDPARAAQIVQIQQQSLEAGLQLMDSMDSLDPETGGTITPTNTGQPTTTSTAGGAGGLLSAGQTATAQGLNLSGLSGLGSSNANGSSTVNPSSAGGEAAGTPTSDLASAALPAVALAGSLGGALSKGAYATSTAAGINAANATAATAPVTGDANMIDSATPTGSATNLVNSPIAAAGTAAGLYGIASGISKGGAAGDAQAAVSAGSLAAKAGVLPEGSSAALGAAGSVLGLYGGLKQGGAAGDTQAALSAAQLGVQGATATGAMSAGTGAALGAGVGALGLALAPALIGMSTPAVALSQKYWDGVSNSLQSAISSGDKGQMAEQVMGLLSQQQSQIPANIQQLVYSTGLVPSGGWGNGVTPQTEAAASQVLAESGQGNKNGNTRQSSRM